MKRRLKVLHVVHELDYGGLVSLLSDDVLEDDDSPGLVARGLAALSKGDADTATEAYEQLVTRWRAVQLLETSIAFLEQLRLIRIPESLQRA